MKIVKFGKRNTLWACNKVDWYGSSYKQGHK